MNPESSKISPYSLVMVTILMMTSQYWMDWLRELALQQPLVSPLKDVAEAEEILWSPAREHLEVHAYRYSKDQVVRRLIRENEELKKELQSLKSLRKVVGEDAMVLSVEKAIASIPKHGRQVIAINAGDDYGLKMGDWLICGNEVVGQLTFISQRLSLVDPLTAPESKFFVTIDNLPGHYIWEGQGDGIGHIRVRRDDSISLVGESIFLDGPRSDTGRLWVGRVIENRSDRRGGWELLVVEGRKNQPDDILHVLQKQTSIEGELFAQRDRLSQLKNQVRRLELDKLRLESLQN